MRAVLGIALALAVAATGLTVSAYLDARAAREAYDRAPVCATEAQRGCRRRLAATVTRPETQVTRDIQHLGFTPADPTLRRGSVPVSDELYRSVRAGDPLELELWQGAITMVKVRDHHIETRATPQSASKIFVLPGLLVIALGLWNVRRWRR